MIVWIYVCSILLPHWVFAQQLWSTVSTQTDQQQSEYVQIMSDKTISFPPTQSSPTNDTSYIVSLFVDKDIYSDLSDQIKRYATQYIQQKLPRTKVLVVPISVDTKPQDIALINSNLYHDGIKGKSSHLVGTIVIGSFDLPTVRNNQKSIRSVYPRVDFEDVQFPRNASGQRFEFIDNTYGQAEVRHGIIDFDTNIQEYKEFFARLKVYHQDPMGYVSKRIWVDDFVKLKKSYDSSKLLNYANNFIFAEDKSYHRFTPMLSSLLVSGQAMYDGKMTEDYLADPMFDLEAINQSDALGKLYQYNTTILPGMSRARTSAQSGFVIPVAPDFVGSVSNDGVDYADQFHKENDKIKEIITDSKKSVEDSLGSPDQTMFRQNLIPTKFLGVTILKNFQSYQTLFSDTYLNGMYENIDAGGRYLNSKFGAGETDNHIRYLTLKDHVSIQTIRDLNDIMEQALDRKIQKEKYSMNRPLLNLIQLYKHCPLAKCEIAPKLMKNNLLRSYEQFFFGKNAMDIIQASETTIFRGSFANIDTLSEAQKLPLHGQILGGSYSNLTATETACHAGYHFQKSFIDDERAEAKFCGKKKKKVNRYKKFTRGNMTPLNIDQDSKDQISLIESEIDPMLAWNPSFNKQMGRSAFDLRGCMMTSGDMIFGKTDKIHDGHTYIGRGGPDQGPRMPFSYAGYSDTYLGADYFGSVTRTWTSTLCGLHPVNICQERQKAIHPDDYPQIYTSNFFDLIQKVIPDTDNENSDKGMFVHVKKGFETVILSGGFFYHQPVIEKNQPVYLQNGSGNVLLGTLQFPGVSLTSSGDLYPSGSPKFIPSAPVEWSKINSSLMDNVSIHAFSGITNTLSITGNIGQEDLQGSSHPYMTLIAGDSCSVLSYKKIHQYFYHTIDSRLYHKSPTEGEISSMDSATLARPVDDPRYISFQGIAGTTIRMAYPNLYDTPIQGDVTIESIQDSIVSYLQSKAKEQINTLQAELAGSYLQYSNHQEAYDLLAQVDIVATPLVKGERTYQIFDQDFYVKALGATGLVMASENIYYQLRNRKGYTNQTFTTVGDQIDWMKKNFNFNPKIEYIMGAYLTHDSQESDPGLNTIRKNIIGINDGYRQQGYEVAWINSDGDDNILMSNPLASQYPKGINRETQNNLDGGAGYNGKSLEVDNIGLNTGDVIGLSTSGSATASDIGCGDQNYGSVVSLTKWPKALKCWLQETLRNPISLTINFKSAKGSVLTDQIMGGYLKDAFRGDYSQTTDKFSKLQSGDWMEISNPWKQYVGRELENQQTILQADNKSQSFANFVIKDIVLTNHAPIIDVTAVSKSGSDDLYRLDLGTIYNESSNYGSLQIRIYSTGDNCIHVFDQQQCEPYVFESDFKDTLHIPFRLDTHQVGQTIVDVGICLDNKTCYYKSLAIQITSSQVDHIEFRAPSDRLTQGYQTPLIVFAYDKYGNRVYRTSDNYRLVAQGAKILQGKTYFSNFNDAIYLLVPDAPVSLQIQKNTQDLITFDRGSQDQFQTIGSHTLDVQRADIQLSRDPVSISRLGSIPGNEYKYLVIKGIPRAFVEIESLSGILQPGVFKFSTGITSPVFIPNQQFEAKDILTIPLKPTYKAGDDRIRVRIHLDNGNVIDKMIETKIHPGFPYKIHLDHDHRVVPWGSSVTGEVIVTDMYGNVADLPVEILMTTQIPLCVPEKCSQALAQDGITYDTVSITGSGVVQFDTYQGPKDGMGGQGIAQLKMLTFPSKSDIHIPAGAHTMIPEQVNLSPNPQGGEQTNTTLTVEYKGLKSNILWPTKNLNVMYMTLVGSGWSDLQYDLFAHSNKLLSLTTMIGTNDIVENSYKSIQDTLDTKLNISWRGDFKNITTFSQGHIVGESTKGFGSYRLINYGDPVLTKIDANRMIADTPYDAGIGKYVYSYPDQQIKQTDEVDFDGDGFKDVIVTFTNGIIRLLKAYLKHPTPGAPIQYRDIGMIGRVGDGLVETKANPDGLFLRSTIGKVRRYPFSAGKMAVDGDLICLDIPGGPELMPVYRVPQIHFVDLDLQGGTDILTSDYLGRIIATYSHSEPNPIDIPVKDVKPFQGPSLIVSTGYVRTMLGSGGVLTSGSSMSQSLYRYQITISDPDPLKYNQKSTIYLKDLGSLVQNHKLKYILDTSHGGWKTSVLTTNGRYYADTFDLISGIQPVFEDLPYHTDTPVGHSYISNSKFYCDRWWQYRQSQGKNRIVIEQGSIEIGGANDQSLVAQASHDNSTSLASYENNLQKELNDVDASVYQEKYASIMDYPSDPQDTLFVPTLQDTKVPLLQGPMAKAGFIIPSPIPGDSLFYCPINICLDYGVIKSVGSASRPGDYVTVSVYFHKAVSRYIERMQGPWKILRQADGKPLNYKSSQKTGTMIPYFDDLPDGYVMYVDNIMPMQRLTYTVQYIGADVYNITPEYLNCDAYPDIKVAGRNGCNKKFNYYLNHGQSWNTKQFDLAQWLIQIQQGDKQVTEKTLSGAFTEIAKTIQQGDTTSDTASKYDMGETFSTPFVMINRQFESNPTDMEIPIYNPSSLGSPISTQDYEGGDEPILQSSSSESNQTLNSFSDGFSFVIQSGLIFSVDRVLSSLASSQVFAQTNSVTNKPSPMTSAVGKTQRWIDTANQWTNYGDTNLNIDFAKSTTQMLQKSVDKVLHDLCNGFQMSPGGKCPKPFQLPFNMAFLAPGTYNFMGKKLMEDKGLPVFFFPGTLYAPAPIPIPYGQKSDTSDEFYWMGGGTLPSMIRFYLAPTISMGLGFGLCFSPDKALRKSLKKPFKDIVGNCLAFALNLNKLEPRCLAQSDAGGVPSLDDSQGAHSYPTSATRSSSYTLSGRLLDFLACPECILGSDAEKPVLHAQSSVGDFTQQSNHVNETMDDNDIRGGHTSNAPILDESDSPVISGSIDNTLITTPDTNNQSMGKIDAVIDMLNGIQTNNDINERQGITIEKVKEFNNKIKGGASVGIMPAIQRWVEQQIEYIINNAMHLDIKIYTPDLKLLVGGFEDVQDGGDMYGGIPQEIRRIKSLSSDTQGFKRVGAQKTSTLLSSVSSNPFDKLAHLFENVSLFRFEQKDITIKLPMIYSEDISRYTSYLKGRLANQEKISQQREEALQSCLQGKGVKKLQNCDLIETRATKIKSSITQFERSIRKNITTLEYYRNLPGQLTQYLNVHERYLAEVTETYGGLISTINNWMTENSLRFEKRVESLILLVGIIKTRQIIPDFALNRSEKCSKCSVDTYSYLSEDRGSLTPSLPILPIPPFRIPDIILDLSKINIGLTVVLPNFIVVPTRVSLPQLPDIPSPSVVDLSMPDLGLHLPQIPQLPELQLPPFELPSFVPQIELQLPMLPPAVKIPKINPGIRTIVKLVEFLGNLVCIYKRGFGLVGESSLKTKIEQLTQRNIDLFPFDALIDLAPISPLKGYDIRIDTFINFAFNFEGVYDVFKTMADTVNSMTDNIAKTTTHVTDVINQSTNYYNNFVSPIPESIHINYDYKQVDYQQIKKEFAQDLIYATTVAIIPFEIKNTLKSINNLIHRQATISLNQKGFISIAQQGNQILQSKLQEITQLKHMIDTNYDQFVHGSTQYQFVSQGSDYELKFNIFTPDQQTIDTLKDMQDPDKIFLDINHRYIKGLLAITQHAPASKFGRDNHAHIQIRKLLSDLDTTINHANQYYRDQYRHGDVSVILAQNTLSNSTQDGSIVGQQNSAIGGVGSSSQSSDIASVGGTKVLGQGSNQGQNGSDVNTKTIEKSDANNQEIEEEEIVEDDSQDEDIPSEAELDQLNQGTTPQPFVPSSSQGASVTGNYTDLTNQIQGYFAPVGPVCEEESFFGPCTPDNVCTQERVNIIDSSPDNINLYKSQPHHLTPQGSPLLLHDHSTVFFKTAGSQKQNAQIFDDYYNTSSFESIQDMIDSTHDGYLKVNGEWFKLWDHTFEIYDLQAKGQNYENISFQWSHIGASGYILRVTDRVDVFPDRVSDNPNDPGSYIDPVDSIKYILVLPFGTDTKNLKITVNGEFKNRSIDDLEDADILLSIQYFRPQDKTLSVILENLPRQRYYVQVRALGPTQKSLVGLLLSPLISSYTRATTNPWSTQQMGGMQIVADNTPPSGVFNLVRKTTGKIEGTGLMLDGVIMTHYKLVGTRDDNTKIMYSRINHNGKLIKRVPGNRIELDELYFTGGFNETYEFGAIDSAGMTTVEQVVMDVRVPDIQIININGYSNRYAEITAQIARDMDEGSVRFERLRNVLWTSLTDIDGRILYPLVPGQTIVTGGLYDLIKSYDLKDTNGDIILSIDPKYPNIILPPDQQENYILHTNLQNSQVGIDIIDKKTHQTVFTYYPVSQSVSNHQPIQITSSQYKAIPIQNTANPQLNGGTCIAQTAGECQILIDNRGNPLIPPPYNHTLQMEYHPGGSGLASYQFYDPNHNPIANISVVLKPLD